MKNKMIISVILISISMLSLIFISWLLWNNREDEKTIEVFVQVLIGLIAALLIIIFRFLSPISSIEKEIKFIQLRDKNNTYNHELSLRLSKNNAEHQNAYRILGDIETFDCANFADQKLNETYNRKTIGLDLLEYAVWQWLGQKYSNHWDNECYFFEGISGSQSNCGASKDADKETTIISFDSIKTYLNDNPVIIDNGRFYQIALPSNIRFEICKRDNVERSYRFKNNYIDLSISIRNVGTSGTDWTLLGESIKRDLNFKSGGLYTDNFIIKINCGFSKFKRGNSKLVKQKKWVEDMVNQLSYDFDWAYIKKELERIYKL